MDSGLSYDAIYYAISEPMIWLYQCTWNLRTKKKHWEL